MKASDLLVRALEAEGVERIFGIPGEENLDFLESLRGSKIQLVLTRHEQGAGFMAAAYGRLTGKTGVCLSTLGPGATNFVTCAAYAMLGGMPVLFITGQKPIGRSKQGRFQIVDIVRMMEPLTKLSRQVVDANNIPQLVRECFRVAQGEKPGAVHLELPEDVAAENVDRQPFPHGVLGPPCAETEQLDRAAAMIKAAKRPLVVFASATNRWGTFTSLRRFIEKTGLYFVATQMGKGVVDERDPRCLGTTALSSGDYVHMALDNADLIVTVGHDVSEKPPYFMHAGDDTKVMHVAYFRAQMDDVYFPHLEVLGSVERNMALLADRLEGGSPNWDCSYFEKVRAAVEEHVYARCNDNDFPVRPQRIVSDVRQVMPSDGILSLDNGMYKIWFARNYKAHAPNTVLLDNALATMGAGLPCAIGAKLTFPDRKVMAVCGDGGFMMNSQELETAVRLGLDLVVLILRDDAYGMIRWKQAGMGFDDFGLQFHNPDFVKYAESYGAHGVRVESTDGFAAQLEACLSTPGVHVIDCPVDYSENERVFYDELRKKTEILL